CTGGGNTLEAVARATHEHKPLVPLESDIDQAMDRVVVVDEQQPQWSIRSRHDPLPSDGNAARVPSSRAARNGPGGPANGRWDPPDSTPPGGSRPDAPERNASSG